MEFVGARMQQARKEAKISQKTAAREMKIDPSDLSKIENCRPGARVLRAPELIIAARLYNKSVDWLLGLSPSPYLRPDLAWRLSELPPEVAVRLIETPIYLLHEYLEHHELLPRQLAGKMRSKP